jgi:hypothetical protein
MTECAPGKHRTLVLVETGTPLENPNNQSMICLSCGLAFAAVRINIKDKGIEDVLKKAAKNTRDNLRTLRSS